MKETVIKYIIFICGLILGFSFTEYMTTKENENICRQSFTHLSYVYKGAFTIDNDFGADHRQWLSQRYPDGIIQDAKTAIDFAQPVLYNLLGRYVVERQQPYRIILINDSIWKITPATGKGDKKPLIIYLSKENGGLHINR